MDPKQSSEPSKVYKCQNDEDTLDTEQLENASTSHKCFVVRLEGTHTGATETDNLESNEILFPINENLENMSSSSALKHTKKFSTIADTDPTTQYEEQCRQKRERNLFEDENTGENKVTMKSKPVEEMLQKMNENIQTIMDMFGPKSNNATENELEIPKARKQVSFQGSRRSNNDIKASTSHRSRFDKFLEAKKSHLSAERDPTEVQKIVPNSSQEVVSKEISHDSPVRCATTDTSCEVNILMPSGDVENIECERQSNDDSCELNSARLPKIREEDITIPIYESLGTGAISMAPCEHILHTLHIEAASSPTSSIMYRPPLCVRFWKIVTDFITTLWLCLQVNRDCIFCLGFFVAFLVSASFLTAFFYRTLSVDPQELQKNQQTQQLSNIIDMRKPK